MAGLPGTRLALDPLPGPRTALVVATARYEDPELRQLRAPAHDAEDLAEVLGDPGIGGFAVTRVIDADERQVRREIDLFLSGRGVSDLVVVYLSCHGVLDRRNRLYFAASDTLKTQLGSTGIPSAWLLDQLEECRARRQVLILDCCFSGAFAHGSKGDTDLDLERRLAGHGRGQAVLTASRAGEYSFEGLALPGAVAAGSVFTAGLVEGLRNGAADAGGDGYVSVDEAFDYAYGYVQSSGASQTPQRWLYGGEGAIVLARSPAGIAITPAPLPEALAASLDSPYPAVRVGAVNALGEWLSGDPARALTAEQKLRQIADADVPAVAAAARACLSSLGPADTGLSGQEFPAAKPSTRLPSSHPAAAGVHGGGESLQAADRVAGGVASATELIARTLGPKGRKCVVRDMAGTDIEASDARTIVEHFAPEDPRDTLGASYVRDLVRDQQHAVHDGGATAAVLAHTMAARAMEAWRQGANPRSLMRGMDAAVAQVNEELSKLAKDVETLEQLTAIAATSAGDTAIGEIIAKAFDYVGKEGVTKVEAFDYVGREGVHTVRESSSFRLELRFREGMVLDKGYISPRFVTDQEWMEAILDDPYILIADFKLSASKGLLSLLDKVVQTGKPLAILAEDVEGEALESLIAGKIRDVPKSVAVKATGSCHHRRAVLGDIAILTGGQIISDEAGPKLETVGLDLLGHARKVIVTKDETHIVDGMGDADQIAERINQIRDEIENAGSDHERKNLQWRLANLAGGVAAITVGAATEAARQQLKERIEAAIMTARGAIESGMLPGGGAALADVQRRPGMRNRLTSGVAPPTSDETTGTTIVLDSLDEPLKQIVANAGHDDPAALADSIRSLKPGTGFDVITDKPRDMLAAGIIDTFLVTSTAIANAVGLAQRLLLLG